MASTGFLSVSILLLLCLGVCDSQNVINKTIQLVEGGTLDYHPPDLGTVLNFACQGIPTGIVPEMFLEYQGLGSVITAKAPFDREEMVRGVVDDASAPVRFECTYLLRDQSSQFQSYTIRIDVLDLNDNSPTFDNGLEQISSTYPETGNYDGGLLKVSIPTVVDLDEGRNGTDNASFTLTHESVPGLFTLVPKQERNRIDFEMISTRPVDWESYRSYQSTITVFDGGDPPRSSSLSVNLSFTDNNDNRPVFSSSRYDVCIQENAQIGTEVMNLTAVDPDVGINAPLTYEIHSTRYFALSGGGRDQLIEIPSNEWFEINATSGLLTTRRVADREAYDNQAVRFVVTVRAMDSPTSFGETFVYIDIKDANDNSPHITYDPVYRQVPEDFDLFPIRLGTLCINDPDNGTSGMYNMRILTQEGQPSTQFTLADGVWNTTRSGAVELDLFLNSRVDYDTNKVSDSDRVFYHIVVVAEDFGEIPQTSNVTFDIEVEDVDDNPPVFSSTVYFATVPEEIADTCVYEVMITDMDGPNNRNNHFLLPASQSEYYFQDLFQVNPATGVICTRGKLDRESLSNDTIPLLVVVESAGSPSRHVSSATVVITVDDTNDNAPVFQGESTGKATVLENEPHGTVVATVTAFDIDSTANSKLEYSLMYQSLDQPFAIDRDSGIITTTTGIDAETHPMPYHFIVQVYDGVHTSSLNFSVEVEDVNDNIPYFEVLSYTFSIMEDTEIGTVTRSLIASDNDSPAVTQLHYIIQSGNEEGHFSIQEDGSIIVIGHLDRERVSSYTLTVSVSDGMNVSDTPATITISVLNVNDSPPQFTRPSYAFSILENSPSTSFGQVSAFGNDRSFNNHLTFSIEGIDNVFRIIDEGTLQTFSFSTIDREATPFLNFTVLASDRGNPSLTGSASVVVTVLDQDDNGPSFPEPAVILQLAENYPIERTFYTASASDPDLPEHAIHNYTIISVAGGDFDIGRESGELSLRTPLDYETSVSPAEVLIMVSDASGRSSLLNVTIRVTDVNDNAPVFPVGFPHYLTVVEGLPGNQLLHTFIVSDPDESDDLVQIALTTPSGGSVSKFHIIQSHNTGSLYTSVSLNREQEAIHTLRIVLTDSGSLSSYLDIQIEVQDVNDNQPIFDRSSYTFTVLENQPNGTEVDKVAASDSDAGDNGVVMYSFLSPSSLFAISPTSGVVQTLVPLDRESQAEYALVVVARDNGISPQQSSVPVVIQIADVNDNAPEFGPMQEFNFQVHEDSAPGARVAELMLSDADEDVNADITLTILSPYADGPFGFHGRYLIVSGQLDFEDRTRYMLHIQGMDGGGMSVTKAFTITVVDVNDETPQFVNSPVNMTVREDTSLDTVVAAMRATDADGGSGGMVRYSIGMGNYHDSFKVNSTTGDVSVLNALDYETVPSYTVEIIAEDLGEPPLATIALLHVTVENTNDNSPYFEVEHMSALLSENATNGTDVLTVKATDVDNGSIQYSILVQSPAEDAFRIDAMTGTISVNAQLDYLRVNKYSLEVSAADEDGLYSLLQVDIFVTNVNDNDPEFRPPLPASISIPENTRVGYILTTVSAIDPDNATYSAVSLTVSGEGSGHFEIDLQLYYLRLVSELNAEDRSSISLTVRAVDTGFPPNEAEHVIVINVQDVNDNTPTFLRSSYSFELKENMPVDTYIGQVTATDADITFNKTTYMFSSQSDLFWIEEDTGIIRNLAVFDFESLEPDDRCSSIVAIATDSDPVPTSASVDITLCIADSNDHAPLFHVPVYYFSVSHIAESESDVGMVTAEDGDVGSNSQLYYSLNGSSAFSIDRVSGTIRLEQSLGEAGSEYELAVTATDGGIPALSATVRVVVYAISSTDRPPAFQQVTYSFTVMDNSSSNVIGSVIATDPPESPESMNLLYSVQYADPSHFVITDAGELSFAQTPDHESIAAYNLIVVAEDVSGRRTSAYVDITVADINDNPPQIVNLPSSVQVSPSTLSGVLLTTLQAVDPDEGNNGQLSFTVDSPTGVPLEVNPSTGAVTTTGALEVGNAFVATFTVQDHGTPSLSSSVSVSFSVIDASDSTPDFGAFPSYTVTVLESATVGQPVHTFTATSRIISDPPRTYFLAHASFPDGLFELVPDTGELVLQGELDYETATYYTFIVFALQRDSDAWLSDYINVTLMVVDVNDNPPLFTPMSISPIREDRPKDDVIFRVVAHDLDSGDAGDFRYSITSQSYAPALKVDPDTGEVYVNSGLDAERGSMFYLVVTATDLGRPTQSSSQLIEITVVDVNDHMPTFYGDENISLPENSALDVIVYLAHADDRDPSANLTYSITSVTATRNMEAMPVADNAFTISEETGEIRLNHRMDRETIDQYILKVSVTDQTYSDTVKVTLTVLDVNDNPPQFLMSTQSVEVDELAGIGTKVVRVFAADKDWAANGQVTYYLSNSDSEGFTVDADTGLITLTAPMRSYNPQTANFQFTVYARDKGSPSLSNSMSIAVTVRDVNDHPPQFHDKQYEGTINVITPINDPVLSVDATDADRGANAQITYRINPSGTLARRMFAIRQSGVLEVIGNLIPGVHTFTVEAWNGSPEPYEPKYILHSTTEVTINVVRTNDYTPIFESPTYAFTVAENSPLNSVLHSVMAIDADYGSAGSIVYGLSSSTGDHDFFSINTALSEGQIVARNLLDREAQEVYEFTVTAVDSASVPKTGSATVRITLSDENDNSPTFMSDNQVVSNGSLSFSITENVDFESLVGTVSAVDDDKGENSQVAYSLFGAQTAPFYITENTGRIRTNGLIDREKTANYTLYVTAVDRGRPPRITSVIVSLRVEDVNEFAPRFLRDSYVFPIPATTATGAVVGAVTAYDEDDNGNAPLYYSIIDTVSIGYVRINDTTGDIILTAERRTSASSSIVSRKRQVQEDSLQRIEALVEVRDMPSKGQGNSIKTTVALDVSTQFVPVGSMPAPTATSILSLELIIVIAVAAVLSLVVVFVSLLGLYVCCRRRGKYKISRESPKTVSDQHYMQDSEWDHDGKYVNINGLSGSQVLDTSKPGLVSGVSNPALPRSVPSKTSCRSYEGDVDAIEMGGLGHRESPCKLSSSHNSSAARLPTGPYHGTFSSLRSTSDLGSTVATEYLHDPAYLDTSFNEGDHILMQVQYQETASHHSTHMFDQQGGGEGDAMDRWGTGDEDSVKGFNDEDDVDLPYANDLRSRSSGLLLTDSELGQHYRWRSSKEADIFRSQTMDVAVDEMTSGTDEPVWHPAPARHHPHKRARSSQGHVSGHPAMYNRQRSMDPRLMNSSHNMYQGADGYYQPPYPRNYLQGAKSYSGLQMQRKASSAISEPFYPPRGYRLNGRHSAMSSYSHSHYYPGHPVYPDEYWEPYQDAYTQSTHPDSLSQPSVSPMDDFALTQPSYGPEPHYPFMSSNSSISVASTQISRQEAHPHGRV